MTPRESRSAEVWKPVIPEHVKTTAAQLGIAPLRAVLTCMISHYKDPLGKDLPIAIRLAGIREVWELHPTSLVMPSTELPHLYLCNNGEVHLFLGGAWLQIPFDPHELWG